MNDLNNKKECGSSEYWCGMISKVVYQMKEAGTE